MGTPNRTTPDASTVLAAALTGGRVDGQDAHLSGASRLAFRLFYKHNTQVLHDMRSYSTLEQSVTPDDYRRQFAGAIQSCGGASQILLLHSWSVTPHVAARSYMVFLSRSPRRLFLVFNNQLILQTDEPAELFAEIDKSMEGIDASKLSWNERLRLDVASRMMDQLAIQLKESVRLKRSSADNDERAANALRDALGRLGFRDDL